MHGLGFLAETPRTTLECSLLAPLAWHSGMARGRIYPQRNSALGARPGALELTRWDASGMLLAYLITGGEAVSCQMVLLKKTHDKLQMLQMPPHGPGFDEHTAEMADVMEIHGSTLLDISDRCVFVLRDKAGHIIGEVQAGGY